MPRFDILHLAQHYYQTSTDTWLWLLFVLMGLDVLTGLLKAWVHKGVNSSISLKGWGKHSGVAVLGILVYPILTFIGFEEVAVGSILLAIVTYAISVAENLGELNVPLPKFVYKRLERLREELNKEE